MYLVLVIAVIFGLLTAALLMALYLPPPQVVMRRLAGLLVRVPWPVWAGIIVGLALLTSLSRLHLFLVLVACLITLLLRPPQALTRWLAFTGAAPAPVARPLWLGIILGLFLLTSLIPLSETDQLARILGWDVALALSLNHLSLFLSYDRLPWLTRIIGPDMTGTIGSNTHECLLLAGIATWGIVLTLVCLPRRRAALPLLTALALIIAHNAGYKIYGRPVFVDNHAQHPMALQMHHLELPNIVVATDGSRHAIPGITFRADVVQRPPVDQRRAIARGLDTLAFSPDATRRSGRVALAPFQTNCGTGFQSGPFPRRLPLYYLDDLALVLRDVVDTTPAAHLLTAPRKPEP